VKIGYARTSTLDQVAGFEAQRRDLEAAGCTRIFAEQISSVAERPELAAALDYLRDDDTLVATKIDRLARSVPDLQIPTKSPADSEMMSPGDTR
jgi:DNA invertase Pin-like site-specific DNA recombinase